MSGFPVPELWAHVTKITSFTAVRVRVELRTYKCIIIRQGVQLCSLMMTVRTIASNRAGDHHHQRLAGALASAHVEST